MITKALFLLCMLGWAIPARGQGCTLCGEWLLADFDPGYDLSTLPPEARAEVQLLVEQMRQTGSFVLRADSTYTFRLGQEENGYWTKTDEYILTNHGASRPDTLWIEQYRADTLRLRMHDMVADQDYRFTLVPAFQLRGMAAFLPGTWQLSRVEYDPREVQEAKYREALRTEIDSLRRNSRLYFSKDGYFHFRMLGSENEGRYQVAGSNLTTIEESGARTTFTIGAASTQALLLISYDPDRTPRTLQLVLTPIQEGIRLNSEP